MEKLNFAITVAGILGVSAGNMACTSGSTDQSESAPNIIFILVDDMGYGELSCYNPQTRTPTPHIDRIAQTGVMMTNAYASPVSSPTRTAFLTGSYPQRCGVYGNHDGTYPGIGPMRPGFVENMKTAGYATAWVGKWHQGWDVSNHPANNGFDFTYGFLGGMHDYYDPSEGSHYIGGPFAKNCYVFNGTKPVDSIKYLTEELTDQAISFIGQPKQGNPFFLYLAYNTPHTPIQAPDEVILKYLREGYDAQTATRCAMIEVLDLQVGRLLGFLETEGLRQNTLVVLMSDNGPENEYYAGGLRGTKMTAWEGGIRVPMLACLPSRIAPGQKSNSVCSIMDMASTFIGLTKGDDEYKFGDGVNLMPYYTAQKNDNAHDTLIFSVHMTGAPHSLPTIDLLDLFAVRSGDLKLVIDKRRKVNALYDLSVDPAETNDLSQQYAKEKERLIHIGTEFLKECPPACGKIMAVDTRKEGDANKLDSLKKHCEKLLAKDRNR